MLDVIEGIRDVINKNKFKLNGKDKEIIEEDLYGVESSEPNRLVIAAGVLLLLIACVTVFLMASRRNASVQRLSVVIKERFSNVENGKTIKVKKSVLNNTVDVIDGQAVNTETDRAPKGLRLNKQAKSAYD